MVKHKNKSHSKSNKKEKANTNAPITEIQVSDLDTSAEI